MMVAGNGNFYRAEEARTRISREGHDATCLSLSEEPCVASCQGPTVVWKLGVRERHGAELGKAP